MPKGKFVDFVQHMDLVDQDALTLSAMMHRGETSAEALMAATLQRIEQTNGAVNAIVDLRDGDVLMAEARAADAGPRKGWMQGLPIAIKDLANVAGMRTTLGSPLFAEQVAEKDDVMVARIKAAGAIVIGKTNTPEFGLGSHTFNPVHGATCNPYDTSKSAGGSSGGAAAALACGMLSIADGSDMMGSLRNPAGWNNVYGMRPSWGTVIAEPDGDFLRGILSTSGPMARSPDDLAALLETMTGQAHLSGMDADTAGMRLGWLGDWDGALPFEDGLMQISKAAIGEFSDMGLEVEALSAPFELERIWESWIELRSFSVAAGLRPLWRDDRLRAALKPSAEWEAARGMGMSAEEVMLASAERSAWFTRAMALFSSYDVLVLPSAQVWPFPVEWVHPKEIAGVTMDTYHRWMQVVVPAGLLGLPVVNVPIGFGAAGLPAGVQLIGPPGSDTRLLALARRWHAATGWPQKRPPVI